MSSGNKLLLHCKIKILLTRDTLGVKSLVDSTVWELSSRENMIGRAALSLLRQGGGVSRALSSVERISARQVELILCFDWIIA